MGNHQHQVSAPVWFADADTSNVCKKHRLKLCLATVLIFDVTAAITGRWALDLGT